MRDRIVGFFPRYHGWSKKEQRWSYLGPRKGVGEYSFVIPSSSFLHKVSVEDDEDDKYDICGFDDDDDDDDDDNLMMSAMIVMVVVTTTSATMMIMALLIIMVGGVTVMKQSKILLNVVRMRTQAFLLMFYANHMSTAKLMRKMSLNLI